MQLGLFFFPAKSRKALPLAISKRIAFLVGMDLLLFVYFGAAGFVEFRADTLVYAPFFAAVTCTEAFFAASLALIRLGRYKAASILSGVGILLNTVWLGVLLPIEGAECFYRFGLYLLASLVANSMVALERRHIYWYLSAGALLYIGFVFGKALPALGSLSGHLAVVPVTIFLLIFAVDFIIVFITRLNESLVSFAEEGARASGKKAEALAALIADSRGAFDEARKLKAASEESKLRSAEIRRALEDLRSDSRKLSANAAGAEGASRGVVEGAKSLREAMSRERALLEETVAAIGRIASTAKGLESLADEKKGSVSEVMKTAERQGADVRGLREASGRVQASAARVSAAVVGIADLSEKTGLLAMNASIEAAHAGASGKGFAVISQEVRKLSEETRAQTERIGEALAESGVSAAASAEAAERFAKELSGLSLGIGATFDALISILEGLSSVHAETSDLDRKASELVGLARLADQEVDGQAASVEQGAGNLEEIRDFAGRLAASVEAISGDFASIEAAVENAKAIGERSVEHMARLDRRLGEIDSL
jgi:methyl-accepting chemotaxis protein